MAHAETKPVIHDSLIDPSCHLGIFAQVERSELNANAAVYKMAMVFDSRMHPFSSVGDNAKADHTTFSPYARIGRSNYVTHSEIGRHSYTGSHTMILHSTIGSFCSISWGVTIGPGEHDFSRVTNHSFLYDPADGFCSRQAAAYNRFEAPCELGSDVWVGANATILRGVHIGHGAVIGANALVNQNVPPYAIAFGVPARVARFRFDEKTVQELLSLRWWDFPDEVIRENMHLFQSQADAATLHSLGKLR